MASLSPELKGGNRKVKPTEWTDETVVQTSNRQHFLLVGLRIWFSLRNVADVNACKMSSSSVVLIRGFAKQLVVHRFSPVPIKY